jgi:hypothetical protein
MGLLDDAIREHLELKRRRGADAEEVSRLEHEALGPPQRGEFAAAAAPAEAIEPAEPSEPLDEPPPGEFDDDDDPVAAVQAEPAAAPAPAPAEPEWLEDEPEPPAPAPAADDSTALYDVEAGEPPAEGDDVLEETPDFLQETPEHDRLWFEQKPPRDFDLDR